MTHLCSAFWQHTNIRPGDRIYPCCRFKESIGIFNGDLDQVLFTDAYKDLREKNKNNTYIPGCEKCYYEESIGHKSLRQELNETYNTNEISLKYLEIGLDNLCNLACDGCNSEFSTSWIKKEEEIFGQSKYKLIETKDFNVPNTVNKLLFLGGEPLITSRHYNIINTIEEKYLVDLIYNTNGMFIPEDEKLLNQFKSVKFILSIDGYGTNNSVVREGSNWDKILDFVEWVISQKYKLQINTVLHRNNYFMLGDLYSWITENNFDWYINCLTYPRELDIVNLEDEEKQAMLAELELINVPNKEFIINHLNYKTIAE